MWYGCLMTFLHVFCSLFCDISYQIVFDAQRDSFRARAEWMKQRTKGNDYRVELRSGSLLFPGIRVKNLCVWDWSSTISNKKSIHWTNMCGMYTYNTTAFLIHVVFRNVQTMFWVLLFFSKCDTFVKWMNSHLSSFIEDGSSFFFLLTK